VQWTEHLGDIHSPKAWTVDQSELATRLVLEVDAIKTALLDVKEKVSDSLRANGKHYESGFVFREPVAPVEDEVELKLDRNSHSQEAPRGARLSAKGEAREASAWIDEEREPSTSSTNPGRSIPEASRWKEVPTEPWLLEDRAQRMTRENELLLQKLPMHSGSQKTDARPAQHGGDPPSEVALRSRKKENDWRQESLRAKRTPDLIQQLQDTASVFELELSMLERLARAYTVVAAAQVTAMDTQAAASVTSTASGNLVEDESSKPSLDDEAFADVAAQAAMVAVHGPHLSEDAGENDYLKQHHGLKVEDATPTAIEGLTAPSGSPTASECREMTQEKLAAESGTPRTHKKGFADKLRAWHFGKGHHKHKSDGEKASVAGAHAKHASEDAEHDLHTPHSVQKAEDLSFEAPAAAVEELPIPSGSPTGSERKEPSAPCSTPKAMETHEEKLAPETGTPRTPRKGGLADKLRAWHFGKSHHKHKGDKGKAAATAASLGTDEDVQSLESGTPRNEGMQNVEPQPNEDSDHVSETVAMEETENVEALEEPAGTDPMQLTPVYGVQDADGSQEVTSPDSVADPEQGRETLASQISDLSTQGLPQELRPDSPQAHLFEVTEDLASEDIAVDQQPGDVDVSRPLVSVAVEDSEGPSGAYHCTDLDDELVSQEIKDYAHVADLTKLWHECLHRSYLAVSSEDWSLFAYEMLLAAMAASRADTSSTSDATVERLTLALSICRVRMGIPLQVHQALVGLMLPDASPSAVFPLDVRYRALALFRSWVRSEAACFDFIGNEVGTKITQAWVLRQLQVLRCCTLHRILALQRENTILASTVGKTALSRLASLRQLAENEQWGKPNDLLEAEPGGRRLLVSLMRDLDILRPPGPMWRFHRFAAGRTFEFLWAGAADPYAEDGLNFEGPIVAAALLSGLHAYVGMPPLSMETHAVLLAQQVWIAVAPTDTAPSSAGSLAVPVGAMQTMSRMVLDFSDWLKCTPINAASCFSKSRDSLLICQEDLEEEVFVRKLLLQRVLDGMHNVFKSYRLLLEPDAFVPAIKTFCLLNRLTDMGVFSSDQSGNANDQELRKTLLDFTWNSVLTIAQQQVQPHLSPEVVDDSVEAWKQKGPTIKKFMDGLSSVVGYLKEELECVKEFYLKGAEEYLDVDEHLGICAAALCTAVRPAIECMLQSKMWPGVGAAVLEIPPGGGRLLGMLEDIDSLSRVYPEPQVRSGQPLRSPGSLIEMLSAQVIAALKIRFTEIDQDIVARALAGNLEEIFIPMRPPHMLHCESVVTLWSFVHHALDAQLSLGVPIDLVCAPFVYFLTPAIQRATRVLAHPAEKAGAFRLAARASQVLLDVMKLRDEVIFSGDESGEGSAPELYAQGKKGGAASTSSFKGGATSTSSLGEKQHKERFKWINQKMGISRTPGDVQRNQLTEASLLLVENQAALQAPVQQVLVRLSSIAFCCKELKTLRQKLLEAVNGGDCALRPSQRNAEARVLICEELPDLSDELEHTGLELTSYLAHRIVYVEMQQELFQQLYFQETEKGETEVLKFEDILAHNQDKMLTLLAQVPAHFLVRFIVQLALQITNAWLFVVLDYCRKGKGERIEPHLDDDQEALRQFLVLFVDEAASRARAETGLLSSEDCAHIQEQLADMQKVVGVLTARISTCSADQLLRYSAGLLDEPQQATPRTARGASPGPALRRNNSNAGLGASASETTPRLTPRGFTPRGGTPRKGREGQSTPSNADGLADEPGRKQKNWKVGSKLKGILRGH